MPCGLPSVSRKYCTFSTPLVYPNVTVYSSFPFCAVKVLLPSSVIHCSSTFDCTYMNTCPESGTTSNNPAITNWLVDDKNIGVRVDEARLSIEMFNVYPHWA